MRMTSAIDEYVTAMFADGRFSSAKTEDNYRATLTKHAEDVDNRDPRKTGRDPGQDWESELVTFDRIGAGEAFHVVLDDGTEIAAPMKELVRVMGPDAPGLYGTEAA